MKLRRPRLASRPMIALGAILAVGLGMTGLMKRRPLASGPEDASGPRDFSGPRETTATEVTTPVSSGPHPHVTELPRMHGPRLSVGGLFLAVGLLAIGVACLLSPSSPWAGAASSALLAFLMVALIGIVCRRGPRRACWQGVAIGGLAYLIVSHGPWFDAAVRPTLVTTKVIQWAYPMVIPEGRQLIHHRPFAITSPVGVKDVDMNTLNRGPLDVRIEGDGKESLPPLVQDIEVGSADGDGPVIKSIVLLANRDQLAKLERARCEGAKFVLSRHAAGPFASLITAPPVSGQDFERVGHAFFGIVFALAGGSVGLYFYATNDPATQRE